MVFIILHSTSNPCSYKVYDVGSLVAMFDSFDSRAQMIKQMSVVLNNCVVMIKVNLIMEIILKY